MDKTPHIVIIDGYNMLHRARAGFNAGDYPVIFNFFRGLRALTERLDPTRVIFVTEGKPVARLAESPEYKANRKVAADDPDREAKVAELERFHRQARAAIDMLSRHFPVSVMRHPQHECDDVIHNIIRSASRAVKYTVVSNDTDMIQLLNRFDNVEIYNPMKKEYVTAPSYDYVLWKSLRGDASDNVPGLPGIGDVTAEQLASDPIALRERISDPALAAQFASNLRLIRFIDFTTDDMMNVTSTTPARDWDAVRREFDAMGFKSITNDKSWTKFVGTFDPLFNP